MEINLATLDQKVQAVVKRLDVSLPWLQKFIDCGIVPDSKITVLAKHYNKIRIQLGSLIIGIDQNIARKIIVSVI